MAWKVAVQKKRFVVMGGMRMIRATPRSMSILKIIQY